MPLQTSLAAPCGLYCGECGVFGKECGGCVNSKGKPVWIILTNLEVCIIYDCCVNKQHKEHCGLCDELPCKTFLSCHEAAMSEEEQKRVFGKMQKELKLRTNLGTEAWLKEKKKQGNSNA